MEKAFVLYEQKDGKYLRRVHEGSHSCAWPFNDFLGKPEEGQNPLILLCGPEEELEKLMTIEEAKRKKLVYQTSTI